MNKRELQKAIEQDRKGKEWIALMDKWESTPLSQDAERRSVECREEFERELRSIASRKKAKKSADRIAQEQFSERQNNKAENAGNESLLAIVEAMRAEGTMINEDTIWSAAEAAGVEYGALADAAGI